LSVYSNIIKKENKRMANKVKMSITRALAQVKLIESKLGRAFAGFDVEINGKLKYFPNFTTEQFEKEALVEVTSFEDLFNNRLKIKSAIARANIDTKISLLDTEYSIIELIDLKNSSQYKKNVYTNLINNYNKCKSDVVNQDVKIENEVSKQVEVANSNKTQVSKDLTTTLTETYKTLWGGKIVGLDINKISKEKEDLDKLVAEIDMILSEINSKTEIEVDI
jgi:hypothetical protein